MTLNMKKFKVTAIICLSAVLILSCQDQLDVKNPNQPTANSINTESNIISLGLGVYVNGFRAIKYGGFQGTFLNDVWAWHEAMGDVIGVEAANVYVNQIGMPDWVRLDNGSTVLNPSTPNTQYRLVRFVNQNSLADANPLYYEWAYMYNLNNICNFILQNVDGSTYATTGNVETKKNTLKAWAYFWKGYAYSRIGSIYYAGVINNEVGAIVNNEVRGINSNYVSKEAIITESNANYDRAIERLNAITVAGDYTAVMRALIPTINQVGKGAVPTIAMFIRNINTMKARNILVNTKANVMTNAQWDQILTLTNAGIQAADNVFMGRSNDAGDFMAATTGSVALVAAVDPTTSTYKISERLIQDYKTGDRRLSNNFEPVTGGKWLGNADRGNSFNTRYRLRNNSSGVGPTGAGIIVYANRTAGQGEIALAGTYEENELMKAEANIYRGNLATGLTLIDAVRTTQGAGLASVAGITDPVAAKEELRKERRVGLAFRGLSFYDARRWGVIDPFPTGGRTGAVVVDKDGNVSTNATINYGFLDYWDVPDNELTFNPPAAGSAPVKNPK
jgi:starch-binding outer membrane protein, SusD/RagB family